MDFWAGPTRTGLLLGQVHTKGIASETFENRTGRSKVRALHCLQHRLGSGGHWEGVLQQSQRPFVVQGCPETLFRNGSLELYHERVQRVTGGASPSSRHPGVTSALIPSGRGGRKTCSPLPATRWSLTFLSTAITFSPALLWGGLHMSCQVCFCCWHLRHRLKLVPGKRKEAPG